MMLNLLPLLALSITGTVAFQASNLLVDRDVVPVSCSEQGLKTCGAGCIGLTDTCCPDGSGGCPVGKYCILGNNNKYGCCPNGQVCEGAGGAFTSRNVLTETNTEVETNTQTATEQPAETTTYQPPPYPTTSIPSASLPIFTTSIIYPTGSAPSGSAPSGTAPSGTAPSGTAPSGSAPSASPSYTGAPFPPSAATNKGYSAFMLGGLLAGVFVLLL
ncbi:hypothetical protein PT974_08111 [Cladobotryum mycophilum]|uniref:GPI anchored serine-threonine rich protein n=1 Tax=Cladobotryum mycophilum TaxID=491253 RepID=A0ABR0SCG4_9HYPO